MGAARLLAQGEGNCAVVAATAATAASGRAPGRAATAAARSTCRLKQASSVQMLRQGCSARGGSSRQAAVGRGRGRLRVLAWQPPAPTATEADEATDFYAILGVSYTAGTDEIKRAYRRLAKEFHPDVSADESSTEFAIFLNDVYDTLSDPDKRAAYDAIVGFQIGGVNPFTDTSYERDSVFVDEFTCIGCKNCNCVASATFMMEDEWGRARVRQQGVDGVEKLQEAIDTCPVSCIHWVTAPQLALLEETMSRMERVAAFVLMTGGGKGANMNVFFEASIAWQKRQAALAAKVQADNGWGFFRATPAAGSSMQGDAAASSASSSLGRGVNAATVAAAARRWRDYQRTKRNRNQRMLTTTSSGSISSIDSADPVA